MPKYKIENHIYRKSNSVDKKQILKEYNEN